MASQAHLHRISIASQSHLDRISIAISIASRSHLDRISIASHLKRISRASQWYLKHISIASQSHLDRILMASHLHLISIASRWYLDIIKTFCALMNITTYHHVRKALTSSMSGTSLRLYFLIPRSHATPFFLFCITRHDEYSSHNFAISLPCDPTIDLITYS